MSVDRDYMLRNVCPMVVYDTAAAMKMRGFWWDRSTFLTVQLPTESALVQFGIALKGMHIPVVDEGASGCCLAIDPSARVEVETLLTALDLADVVDVIEFVRVLLLSDHDHDRLESALEKRGQIINNARCAPSHPKSQRASVQAWSSSSGGQPTPLLRPSLA